MQEASGDIAENTKQKHRGSIHRDVQLFARKSFERDALTNNQIGQNQSLSVQLLSGGKRKKQWTFVFC